MSTPTEEKRGMRALAEDRRGAMVVIGTFMAVFLAAGLFYIVGIGESIIYRERVQDAADAVAYSSAGVHARGMNLIVMINLIMAALVAILIFAKLLSWLIQFIVVPALAASIVLSPLVPVAQGFNAGVKVFINIYQQVLKVTLPALNIAQIGIAIGTPWVATLKTSPDVAKEYKSTISSKGVDVVQGGTTISPSLLPLPSTGLFSGEMDAKAMLELSDWKLGLPVQQDSYDNLCKKAGEQVAGLFTQFLPSPIGGWIKKFAGSMIGAAPQLFCGGGSALNISDFKPDFDPGKVAKDMCSNQAKDKYKDDNGSLIGYIPDTDALKACEDTEKKKLEDDKNDLLGDNSTGGGWSKYATPKKIYEGAQIGGGHFQVWSFTEGAEEWPGSTGKGVAMASGQASGFKLDKSWMNRYRIAQAEFYFDTRGYKDDFGKSPKEWGDIKEDSMWKMRWRARLRRFRVSLPEIISGLAGPLFDTVAGKISDKVLGGIAGGGGSAAELLTAGGFSNLFQKWLKDGFGFEFGPLSWKPEWGKVVSLSYWTGKADAALNSKVQQLLATPEIIH